MDRPLAGGRGRISSLILSFLSFTPSQVAHGKGFPGSTGEKVEAAPPREPAPPQQGIKTRHKPPNQPRKTPLLTPETQHLPFSSTGLPKLIESYWTAKCEARKGGECLFSSSFLPFCLYFVGFGGLGFLCPAGFCPFPSAPASAPGCSREDASSPGQRRPSSRRQPLPRFPPTPVKPRQTHTNLNLSFLPPKTRTPGVQPGQRTGEAPSPTRRGASPPCCRPQPRGGAELRLCRPWRWLGCKWPHGRRPATAKNEFKKKKRKGFM